QAVENRLADEEMADVELDDLAQRRDLFRGGEIEAVAGVDFQAGARRQSGAADDALEFGGGGAGLARRHRLAPGSGVKFDDGRADRDRGFYLRGLRGNEQGDANLGLGQLADRRAQRLPLPGGIEAAFGRALLPPLRHEARGVRQYLAGDAHHLARRRHFEVERFVDARLKACNVVVDDVTAILAQMRGDAVGAGLDRNLRRL